MCSRVLVGHSVSRETVPGPAGVLAPVPDCPMVVAQATLNAQSAAAMIRCRVEPWVFLMIQPEVGRPNER